MSEDAPAIVRLTAQPTRTAESGLQVWELINEQTDERDLVIAYTIIPPGTSEGPHVRDTDEFIFYLSGNPEIRVDGGETYRPAPNELIRIPPGISHSHSNPGPHPVVQVFVRAGGPGG